MYQVAKGAVRSAGSRENVTRAGMRALASRASTADHRGIRTDVASPRIAMFTATR